MPLERSTSASSVAGPRRQRSTSLTRGESRYRSTNNDYHHLSTPLRQQPPQQHSKSTSGFEVSSGPPPRMRSTSAHTRNRNSHSNTASKSHHERVNSNGSYERFSPTVSLSSTNSGREFYHHHPVAPSSQHHNQNRYASSSKHHLQHHHNNPMYNLNTNSSSSRTSGVGSGDPYPSSLKPNASSDNGSVNSAPPVQQTSLQHYRAQSQQQQHSQKYHHRPSLSQNLHHHVAVEGREPPSSTSIDNAWKDTSSTQLLPSNFKQMTKSSRRVIDELKKTADASSSQRERRIVAITNACAAFDHFDEVRHNVELQQGAAHALCKVLAAVSAATATSTKDGNNAKGKKDSTDDDEIRMIAAALEMVFRGKSACVQAAFESNKCGQQLLLPLLLRLLERAENGSMKHADVCILNMSKVLLYLSRVVELRPALARQPGMLYALQRVATSMLSPESRIVRIRILTGLINSDDETKQMVLEHDGLLNSLLRVAHLDLDDLARGYAAIALMDLAEASCNQESMAKNEKVVGTLCKMIVVETVAGTRESAITALQNLAFSKSNRLLLVSFKDGIVLECLKRALSSDKYDKSRRRAAGALQNLTCDETAEVMGSHTGLLETMAMVASAKEDSEEVQTRTSAALNKLAAKITVHMSCFPMLLDALVVASLSTVTNSVSAALRVKARDPENRRAMANHHGILDTLADTCINNKSVTKDLDMIRDRDNAMRAIMHLSNNRDNRKVMCTPSILDALVQGASISDDTICKTKELGEIRESAVRAIERLATEFGNRATMAKHEGLLVAIAQATEREQKLEAAAAAAAAAAKQGGSTEPPQQQPAHPYLAKPLLMSLLVAM